MKLWREEINGSAPIMINTHRASPVVTLETERSAQLAERICLAILEGQGAKRLSTRDLFGAVPLAIARYVSIIIGDCFIRGAPRMRIAPSTRAYSSSRALIWSARQTTRMITTSLAGDG
jgi:hypothetical protein